MSDESRRPVREHLTEKIAAMAAMHSLSHLKALSGEVIAADYQTVLAQLELEAAEAFHAAAVELRKPTVGQWVDRLWDAGPLTFRQMHAAAAEAGAPAGEIETLLNRLHSAGLLEGSAGPTAATNAEQQDAMTMPPTKILPSGELDLARSGAAEVSAGAPINEDVTATFSRLVTQHGRAWFDARALAHGIDLGQRIHCQF